MVHIFISRITRMGRVRFFSWPSVGVPFRPKRDDGIDLILVLGFFFLFLSH